MRLGRQVLNSRPLRPLCSRRPPPREPLTSSMASSAGEEQAGRQLVVDPFCFRAFDDPHYSGYLGGAVSRAEFESRINKMFEEQGRPLKDGYAPLQAFLRQEFVGDHLKTPVVEITAENERLLRSGYEARTPEELPVLQRWFDAGDVETPTAEWLDIILYSGEQIVKENAAMGKERTQTEPWGIVSIKPQNVSTELPMQPITNAAQRARQGAGRLRRGVDA